MSTPATASIHKRFAASAARVYDAWLDPDWLARWMFGPAVRDEKIVRLTTDPRVGGEFSFVVDRGGALVDHVGTYLALERPHRLVFTWATRDSLPATSQVTVLIEPLGDAACQLTLHHAMAPEWAAFTERAASSWQKMADALERALAT
ncbi:SRPBCC family protein [Oleiharenicola sp. Vm1]|uniref:SRPBCC family protein n=1 Tax=Oleiharenicola sp. Vm1 TaxID=3398393 RepID=UPI0039F4E6F2